MTLDTIIKEAGLRPCKFPRSSLIQVHLYNDEDQELDTAHYARELFADNTKSAVEFFNFLCYLEEKTPSPSMNIKIDEHYVTVFYKTSQAYSFKRTAPAFNPEDLE